MNKLKLVLCFLLFSAFYFVDDREQQDVEGRKVEPFDRIRVSRAIDVYLKRGDEERVKVEAKGISTKRVLTEVSNGVLKIQLDHGSKSSHNVKVYVTYKTINGISASSASSVFSEETLKGINLNINVSSAADVELKVDMRKITASASSSGDLELKGRTEYLDLDVSSAGGVDAFDLQADQVKVRASSAGGAKVAVEKEIDAKASSGASIKYRGNPERSQTDSSSGGSVRKAD